MPTKPTPIDLPTSDTTQSQKYSHKDFYDKSDSKQALAGEEEATEAEELSLV